MCVTGAACVTAAAAAACTPPSVLAVAGTPKKRAPQAGGNNNMPKFQVRLLRWYSAAIGKLPLCKVNYSCGGKPEEASRTYALSHVSSHGRPAADILGELLAACVRVQALKRNIFVNRQHIAVPDDDVPVCDCDPASSQLCGAHSLGCTAVCTALRPPRTACL